MTHMCKNADTGREIMWRFQGDGMLEEWMLTAAYDVAGLLPIDPDQALAILTAAESYVRAGAVTPPGDVAAADIFAVLPPEDGEALTVTMLVRAIVERISRPYFRRLRESSASKSEGDDAASSDLRGRRPRRLKGLSGAASRRRLASSGTDR